MPNQKQLDIICLIRSENIGPRTYFSLCKKFGSASAALKALPNMAARSNKQLKIRTIEEAEQEVEAAAKIGVKMLFHNDEAYPENLRNIYDPPPVLFYKGNLELLKKRVLGIVGTRNASSNGLAFTLKLARELGERGLVVASGLARGIDTAAHKATLESGTVAVMASGLDEAYPPENTKLFAAIGEKGLLLSENPVGTKPIARHFPQRNRIITGISQGVLVVEAARKSGSMITAEYALREGREVFAVPGSPLDPRCSGTNYLIKTGAQLVENANDVLENLHDIVGTPQLFEEEIAYFGEDLGGFGGDESGFNIRDDIIAKLSHSPIGIDVLIQQSGAPAALVSEVILDMEISGKLVRQFGNKVCLAA